VALVRVNGDDWTVPVEYWDTDGARVVTLMRGVLHTVNSSSADWKQHHAHPCFVEEVCFRRWLDAKRPRTAEAPSAAAATKAFDNAYWDYMMLLAWVYFRERPLVERVAASAVKGEIYWQEEILPDGRHELIESYAGPITPLNLTLHANWRRGNPAMAATA